MLRLPLTGRHARDAAPAAPKGPGPRGWRGRGGGEALTAPNLNEFRGTTFQVTGLWPFSVGASAPMIGVPVGRNLITGATVCCDEISWFQRANLISVPTMWVQAKPGIGKSTYIVRKLLGQYAFGILPLVFGDLKGEYVDLIRALDGQVISLGPGAGALNILDPGESRAAAERLARAADDAERRGDPEQVRKLRELRDQVLADAHTRRQLGVSSLITIARSAKPADWEENIVDRALRVLDARWPLPPWSGANAPTLSDLYRVIRDAPPEVQQAAVTRGSRAKYDDRVQNLEASLLALISGGVLGDMFARQTTEPMRHDLPVVFDVSRLRAASSPEARAAALVTCWQYGFGAINTAHALADAGLEPQRLYAMVLDELWEALRVGHGMPGRVDALTRTNRTEGVGVTMITHSLADTRALKTEEDRQMARGLAERAGVVVLGGLPQSEMPLLEEVVGLSGAEQDLLTSWQDPPAWDSTAEKEVDPPGRGNFLIKVGGGGRPGIPLHLPLTSIEANLHDTSKMWHKVAEVGTVADLPSAEPGLESIEPLHAVEQPPVPPVKLPAPPVPVPPSGVVAAIDHEVATALRLWETDPVGAERMLADLATRRGVGA